MPLEAKNPVAKQWKYLNVSRVDDCETMEQLKKFTQIDCNDEETP